MKKTITIFIAIIIVVGAGSFYGGMQFGKSQNPFAKNGFGNLSASDREARMAQVGGAMGQRNSGNAAGGFVSGDIISKDDKSITVKLKDGGSKIIFLSDKSVIFKNATGTLNDLKTGEQVSIAGKTNQDGSVSADTIQIRPQVSQNSTTQK